MSAKTRPLADLCRVQSGYAFKSKDWQEGGIPVVQIGNVKPRYLDLSSSKFVSADVAAKAAKFELNNGDILISMTGHIGSVARKIGDDQVMLNQRVGRFEDIDSSELDPNYLFEVLQTPEIRERFVKLGYGAAQPNISPKLIGSVEIPIPPIETQQRIAAILGAYDDLIAVNRRRIAILERMARKLFEEWFVRFRFPGHQEVPIVHTSDGPLPKGWRWQRFDELAPEVRNTVDPSTIDGDAKYVGLEHLPRRSTTLTKVGKASDVDSTKVRFERGDILFGKIRPYFHKVAWAPYDGIASSDAIIWRPAEGCCARALAVASSDAFVAHSVQTSNGTKMPRANPKVLAKYLCASGPDELMRRFEQVCEPMVEQAANYEMTNQKLAASRDLLLPRLISGQLAVEADEHELEDVA